MWWFGGPHTAEHRAIEAIMALLDGIIAAKVHKDLSRILRMGSPAQCNAESSASNFAAFRAYGNHKTIEADTSKTYKSVVKDSCKGQVLSLIHIRRRRRRNDITIR